MVRSMSLKNFQWVLFLVSILNATEDSFVIDSVTAVVEGPLRTDVILQSDIKRRGFDGVPHTVQDIAIEIVKDQRGEINGLNIDNEDVDKYLRAMAQGGGISKDTLVAMGKAFGYDDTPEFYRDLRRFYRAQMTMEQEIRSYIEVSEQEIRDYHDEHPEINDGMYYLQTALVPFRDDMTREEQKYALEHQDQSRAVGLIEWGITFGVAYADLADDKAFIGSMKIGDVCAIARSNGFELFKLKNRVNPSQVSFEDRRHSIVEKIREEKFGKAFKQYNDDIMKSVIITHY
jgi:hypothetical protein